MLHHPNNGNPLLTAALDYASRGWPVIPLHNIRKGKCTCFRGADCGSKSGKHPRIDDWVNQASTDPLQIEKWWRQWPDANIGIATGSRSRLFVIDVDGDEGEASLSALEDRIGILPDTRTVLTSRGSHLYYELPVGVSAPGNSAGGKGKDGLDTRGEGGLVVAPPSAHLSGSSYRWEDPNAEPAELPAAFHSWAVELSGSSNVQGPSLNDAFSQYADKVHDFTATFDKHPPIEDLLTAAAMLPNNDETGWHDWNSVGMEIYAASDGSDEGLQAFHVYSAKYSGYNKDATDRRWQEIAGSPPTRTNFGALINRVREHVPHWQPPSQIARATQEQAESRKKPKKEFVLVSAGAWLDEPVEEMKWVVSERIPADDVAILSGDGGLGKTTIALQLAVAVAAGLGEWLDKVCTSGPVIFFSGEEGKPLIHRRFKRICDHEGLHDPIPDLYFHLAEPEAALLGVSSTKTVIAPTDTMAGLAEAALRIRPALIVIDSVAAVYGGNNIDRAEVRTFVSIFRQLARDAGCAVLLLDHPSLSGMTSKTGRSGSMDWQNAVRSFMYMRTTEEQDGIRGRELEVMKLNYGQPGEKLPLYYDDGCFVLEPTVQSDAMTSQAQQFVDERYLECLDAIATQGRVVHPSTGRGYAPNVFAGMPQAQGVTSEGFAKAQERLFAQGQITCVEYGPPSRPVRKIVRSPATAGAPPSRR